MTSKRDVIEAARKWNAGAIYDSELRSVVDSYNAERAARKAKPDALRDGAGRSESAWQEAGELLERIK